MDVENSWSGRGNLISVDPGFVRNPSAGADGVWGTADDDPGDLHLRADGFAVNWGRNELAVDGTGSALTTDLDGNPRVMDSLVDAGEVATGIEHAESELRALRKQASEAR